MKFGLVLAVLLSAAAMAQAPLSPRPESTPAPTKTYTNPALTLTFSYPAQLEPADGKKAAANGQRMMYGEDAQNGSKTSASGSCTQTLLAVETPPRPESGQGSSALTANLTLFDIDLHCLPPKAARNKNLMNTTLRGFAIQGVTELGMMPVSDPVGYKLDGLRAWFAASQGTPVTNTVVQSSQSEVMAVITVQAHQHILAWMLESNDLNFFNRMLASRVTFGPEPGQPLFPVGMQGDNAFPPGP